MTPHRSYLPLISPMLGLGLIKGMAHITGGGITDNLPRILPEGTAALIDRRAWTVPAIFRWLQRAGTVPDDDMFRTFNMGIGLILVCAESNAAEAGRRLADAGEGGAVVIGRTVAGAREVRYQG